MCRIAAGGHAAELCHDDASRAALNELIARSLPVYDRAALLALIRAKALKFGNFTLASGKKATYYLDGKQVTLDAEGARLIGEGMLDLMAGGPMPAAVGGMSIGADPITAAVVTMSAVRGTPLRGFMVRKEPKGHGTNQYVEGPVQPGEEVVIVEDVVTTGGSSLTAIERVEQFGLKVSGVLAIVDRMEGGAEAFRRRGYRFASLLTIRDFGITPPEA
jgi:orotate phosphoribosyltransferase